MSARAKTLLGNLRLCSLDGIAAVPVCYLVLPSNFIVAALLVTRFRLPPEIYGVICSMPFWGNFTQAFVVPFFNRRLLPKTIAMLAAVVQTLCWSSMAVAIGFLPEDKPHASSPWFLGFFAVSALASAMSGVSWTSWVQEWVPRRARGKYFGFRNRLIQVTQIVFLLGVGWLLTATGGSVRAFQVLIGVSVALRVVSIYAQYRTVAGTGPARVEAKFPWRDQLATLAATAPYKWFIAYGAVWGFAANFFGPFYPVFMIEELGCSLGKVSFLIVLTSLGGALSYPAWGSLGDRFGNKPVMLFAMIAWQLQNFCWVFLTPSNAWMLYGMWTFGGMMNAGFTLSLFNIQLKLIPPAAKTLAISLNLAVTALATAVAPILGGWALQRLLLAEIMPRLQAYHTLMLVLPVTALLGCLLLVRVHEVNARPLSSVVGAMRNIRTLSAMLGLGFFVDHIFYRPAKNNAGAQAAPSRGVLK